MKVPHSFIPRLLSCLLCLVAICWHEASASPQSPDAELQAAIEKAQAGKFAEAEILVKTMIARRPFADGYRLLGHIYESEKNLPEAEKAYLKCLKLNPGLESARIRLGVVYCKGGKNDQCIEILKLLRPQIRSNPEALFYLCQAYLEKRNITKALQITREIENSSRNDPEALLSLSRLLVSKELYRDSLPLLNQTVAQLSESAEVHYLLSYALFKTGDHQKMWPHLDKACLLDPNSVPTLILRGRALLELGKLSEAKVAIHIALQLQPDEPKALFVFSKILLEEGDSKLAIERLQGLVQRFPKDPDVHFLLLSAYRKNEEMEKAFEYSLRLADLFPEDPLAHLNAGLDLQHLGKFPEAEVSLKRAINLSKDDSEIRQRAKRGLATVLANQTKYAEAIHLLEEMIQANTGDVSVRLELGDIYLKTASYENALRVLKEASVVDAKNKRVHLLLGKVLSRLDRNDEAREHFKLFEELESSEAKSVGEK